MNNNHLIRVMEILLVIRLWGLIHTLTYNHLLITNIRPVSILAELYMLGVIWLSCRHGYCVKFYHIGNFLLVEYVRYYIDLFGGTDILIIIWK